MSGCQNCIELGVSAGVCTSFSTYDNGRLLTVVTTSNSTSLILSNLL